MLFCATNGQSAQVYTPSGLKDSRKYKYGISVRTMLDMISVCLKQAQLWGR